MTVPMNGLWKSEQRELEAIRELAQSNLVAAKQRAATWAKAAPTRRTLRQAFLRTVRGIYAHLK